jgi:hydrogenase/urease accessory protein HupE
VLLAAAPALAHQSSTSFSTIRIAADGEIDYSLALSTRDLFEALGLESDRDATEAEIRAGEDRLFEYVLARVRLSGESGNPCDVERHGISFPPGSERRVALHLTAHCPSPGKVFIDYELFFDIDPAHTGWATITQGGVSGEHRFKKGLTRRELAVQGGLGLLDFIGSGVEHIFTGYDHLAFLIGLLLVAAIRRREGGGWEPRGLKPGIVYVVRIVTAFTVAHSITLIAAALGWISLPTRFVESAIAASIVYVALENVVRGDPKGRWVLTFLFGLVHGLGFASLLANILPPRQVVVPLLAFNLGIEIGQLSIVALLYPVLHLTSKRAPDRYRRVVILGGSVVIGLLGLLWLVERVADFPLISRVFG